MPSSYSTLQNKFMTLDDDGIRKAEGILEDAGWKVENGWLTPPEHENHDKWTVGEILDAFVFLCDEWDYATIPEDIEKDFRKSSVRQIKRLLLKYEADALNESIKEIERHRIPQDAVATQSEEGYNSGLKAAVLTINKKVRVLLDA